MADKTLNVTITGAEDIFKGLDAQLQQLSKSLDAVTKKIEDQTKATSDLSKEQKKGGQKSSHMVKQWKSLGSEMASSNVSMQGVGKALGSSLIPMFSKVLGPIGMLAGGIKQLYDLFLGYNKRLLETGDVMGHLDLNLKSSGAAFQQLQSRIGSLQRDSMPKSKALTQEFVDTLKGFGEAGLMVSDLNTRIGGLDKAAKIVARYSTVFTVSAADMAQYVGAFTRELNLSATQTEAAFSEIYNAALDARYGTSNFLRIVNQAVPSIANFGGSISEVSRFLQIMGNTGVISMRQAQDTIGALVTGIKNMTMEQRLSASAFVDQENMVKLIQSRLTTVRKQMNAARSDEKALMVLTMQKNELERDLTAAISGDRLAMARTMKRWGAAETMEFTFMQAEKIMGQQLKSLQDITKISAKDEYLLTGILREQGMSEQTLEVLKRLGAGEIKHGGKTIKNLEDLYAAMRNSDEFSKKLNEQLASDQENADMIRNKTLSVIEATLETIRNTIAQKIVPAADAIIKWIASLNIPDLITETGDVFESGIKWWADKLGLSKAEAKEVNWAKYAKTGYMTPAEKAAAKRRAAAKKDTRTKKEKEDAYMAATSTWERKALKSNIMAFMEERERTRKALTAGKAGIAAKKAAGEKVTIQDYMAVSKLEHSISNFTKVISEHLQQYTAHAEKAQAAGARMLMTKEEAAAFYKEQPDLTQNIRIIIKGDDPSMIRGTLEKYFKEYAERLKKTS